MIAYFFALLTLVASLPLLWVSGVVMLTVLDDLIKGVRLGADDQLYTLGILALWLVVGYADYHALQMVFGGGV